MLPRMDSPISQISLPNTAKWAKFDVAVNPAVVPDELVVYPIPPLRQRLCSLTRPQSCPYALDDRLDLLVKGCCGSR